VFCTFALLVGVGARTMRATGRNLNTIVNEGFQELLDKNIEPLIANEMLPLINTDLATMSRLQSSITMMLDADRTCSRR